MKYGRAVDHTDSTRMVDVVEIPDPIPFGDTPDGFLRIMFAHNIAEWEAKGEWFTQVPDEVQSSDIVIGGDLASLESFQAPAEYFAAVELKVAQNAAIKL